MLGFVNKSHFLQVANSIALLHFLATGSSNQNISFSKTLLLIKIRSNQTTLYPDYLECFAVNVLSLFSNKIHFNKQKNSNVKFKY